METIDPINYEIRYKLATFTVHDKQEPGARKWRAGAPLRSSDDVFKFAGATDFFLSTTRGCYKRAPARRHGVNKNMKMKSEHLEHIRAALAPLNTPAARASYAGAGLSATRYRWDILRAAGLIPWLCAELYPYLIDTHIETALRAIIPDAQFNDLDPAPAPGDTSDRWQASKWSKLT